MSESIHGRHVLQMVIASETHWSRIDLVQAMAEKFGTAAFHTCSVQGMSADALIDLFLAKGKMVESVDGITVDPSRMCNHH